MTALAHDKRDWLIEVPDLRTYVRAVAGLAAMLPALRRDRRWPLEFASCRIASCS